MGIIFAVRGDSFTARYASGYNTPGLFATSAGNLPTVDASAATGVIGGSILNLDKTVVQTHQVIYQARGNIGTTRTRSVLMRVAFGSTGSNYGLWNIGGIFSSNPNGLGLSLLNTNVRVQAYNEYATNLTNVNIATWSPSIDTYYDIVLTTTGDGSANGTKVYADGSLLGQTTAHNWTNPFDPTLLTQIVLGAMSFDVASTRIKVNEFVIWDEVIDPTSVTLTSGSGSLNGASRTALVEVSSFNGLSYSDPGVSNVRFGTAYNYNGTAKVGTLADYKLKAAFQQNSSSEITGRFWSEAFGSINTSGLGTGSYTILNLDGTSTGITQSGISDSSGFFAITPTSISSLLGPTMYILQLSVVINGTTYTSYDVITFDNTDSRILAGVNFIMVK